MAIYNPVEIITKKRDGLELSDEEIQFIVEGYVKGEIPDYQFSALLMAILFKGMSDSETFALTECMINSGKILDLSGIDGIKVDKHSTGGVGDKVSIVLLPILAAAGLKIAKMSGRGLGHTGGTLDKLSSIPGLNVELSTDQLIQAVTKIGLAIASPTKEIVPADKKIYALRDVTGTISSIPLIASSVMSKKIAGGADFIIIDLKVGEGAFMKNLDEAEELGRLLKELGLKFNKQVKVVITTMDQPLGRNIGNSLEVIEAIEALKGTSQDDLHDLIMTLGSEMLTMTGLAKNIDEAKKTISNLIKSGQALNKFKEMIEEQGGNPNITDDLSLFAKPIFIKEFTSRETGYISEMKASLAGQAAVRIGAGRQEMEDTIDPAAGIILKRKVGDLVYKGESMAVLMGENLEVIRLASESLYESLKFTDEEPSRQKLVVKIL